MNGSANAGTGNGQAQILDSSAEKVTDIENLNPSTEQVIGKNGDADSVEQGKTLLLQRIEALEKALSRKQIEDDSKKFLQIPVLAVNHTCDRNGKKETDYLGNSGTKEGARSRRSNIENIAESDTEDDEEREDGEEEDSERSGDDDDEEGEEEGVNQVEKDEEQRLIAIRDQLHRTREAWHADQGTSSRHGEGQGQGQGQGIGHGTGSVQRDVLPTVTKLTGSDSRETSQQSSSQQSHKEKNAVDSECRDKVKVKVRSKDKREDDVSQTKGKAVTADGTFTAPFPSMREKEKGKNRKEAGEGTLSDIGHSGGSQTQDLYAAQLARLMSMAEEVISRK